MTELHTRVRITYAAIRHGGVVDRMITAVCPAMWQDSFKYEMTAQDWSRIFHFMSVAKLPKQYDYNLALIYLRICFQSLPQEQRQEAYQEFLNLVERTNNVSAIPENIVADVTAKMEVLEAALLSFDPQIGTHMAAIHKLIRQYPDTVVLLDDMDKIGTLLKGGQAMAGLTSLAPTKAPSKKKTMSVDDLL